MLFHGFNPLSEDEGQDMPRKFFHAFEPCNEAQVRIEAQLHETDHLRARLDNILFEKGDVGEESSLKIINAILAEFELQPRR
jgi:hypothetical protein